MSELDKQFQACYEHYKTFMIERGVGLTFFEWFASDDTVSGDQYPLVMAHLMEISALASEIDNLNNEVRNKESQKRALEDMLPAYDPVKPYHPKYLEDRSGWYICDANGIPFRGVWGSPDKVNPPDTLLSWLRSIS